MMDDSGGWWTVGTLVDHYYKKRKRRRRAIVMKKSFPEVLDYKEGRAWGGVGWLSERSHPKCSCVTCKPGLICV